MSEEDKNLVGLDSLSSYLKGSQPVEAPKTSTPQISFQSENKSALSVLEETNAKIKMMEVGGSIAEKLLVAGNQIVDKIIKAKQMQFMAEQQQREAQNPQKQLTTSQPSINPELVYSGFVQILEFFLSVDKDLKVDDLLTECKEKKELALQMISKFISNPQQVAETQPAHVQESITSMKKEERLENGS